MDNKINHNSKHYTTTDKPNRKAKITHEQQTNKQAANATTTKVNKNSTKNKPEKAKTIEGQRHEIVNNANKNTKLTNKHNENSKHKATATNTQTSKQATH